MKLTNWFLNFDFNGRARRSHMWANWFCWLGVGIVVLIIVAAVGGFTSQSAYTADAGASEATVPGMLALLLLFVVWLASAIDSIAMTFRRAHDTGKSGWVWLLLLVPFVNLLALYWLLIEDSQQGANKYGAPVKRFYEPGAATA